MNDGAMNDNIRVSDAERERVGERLREHYAAGRLTSDELDERLSAALTARTYAELRAVLTDLPEPEFAAPPSGQLPPQWQQGWQPRYYRRPRPRLLPLVLVMLLLFAVLPGAGFLLFAIAVKAVLLLFVVLCVAGLFTAGRFRGRARRYWR